MTASNQKQGTIRQKAAPTERSGIDPDEMWDANDKVKACCAALVCLDFKSSGVPEYADELMNVLSDLLTDAARYLDGAIAALEDAQRAAAEGAAQC